MSKIIFVDFYNFKFKIYKSTLYPRKETEYLVSILSELINVNFILKIIDMGTGSGIIAISLFVVNNFIKVFALDNSYNSLFSSKINSLVLKSNNIVHIYSRWFYSLMNVFSFDLIICNPPYLSKDDYLFFYNDIKYDPICSLVSSKEGFNDLFILSIMSYSYLKINGLFFLEHGYLQSKKLRLFLYLSGYSNIQSLKDFSDLFRFIFCEK